MNFVRQGFQKLLSNRQTDTAEIITMATLQVVIMTGMRRKTTHKCSFKAQCMFELPRVKLYNMYSETYISMPITSKYATQVTFQHNTTKNGKFLS